MHQIVPRTVLRVNAGGTTYIDHLLRPWAAGKSFNTGQTTQFNKPMANTLDSMLYRSERYDPAGAPELRYQFLVPNGNYLVRLHFAENYVPNFQAGKRVFDVDLQGVRVLNALDIYAAVGARSALIESITTTVINGWLTIDSIGASITR